MDKILTFSIAAYNVEDTIEETLSSLICDEETMGRIEALIVDDGSADNTYDRVHPFIEKYPDTYTYVKKENGGHGSTLTYSIQHAKGKYMRMLDGDDLVYSEELPKYIRFLKETDADVVVSSFVEFYNNGKEDIKDRHMIDGERVYPIENTVEIQSHEFAVRTTILQDKSIQLEEHCVHTDVEYCFYSILYSNTVLKYPSPIYRYRKGIEGQTVSDEGRKKRPDDPKRVLLKIMREGKKRLDSFDFSKKKTLIYGTYDSLYNLYTGNIFNICEYSEKEKMEKYVEFYDDIKEIDQEYALRVDKKNPEFGFYYRIKHLPHNIKYIVWGTGAYGKRFVPLIKELYGSNILITDANPSKWGEDFFGETIISPEKALSKREEDSVFVVAMKDGTEVKNQLIDWGVEEDKIYCL